MLVGEQEGSVVVANRYFVRKIYGKERTDGVSVLRKKMYRKPNVRGQRYARIVKKNLGKNKGPTGCWRFERNKVKSIVSCQRTEGVCCCRKSPEKTFETGVSFG